MKLGSHESEGGLRLDLGGATINGTGVIIITGPSSCGKGEISQGICDLLNVKRDRWLSMGDVLRNCAASLADDPEFGHRLEATYGLSSVRAVLESQDSSRELELKMHAHADELGQYISKRRGELWSPELWRVASGLEWLEFCVTNGLLVPNRWTQFLFEDRLQRLGNIDSQPILIDGYPRTVSAAKHLLAVLRRESIPVASVLHLSISRQQMLSRAGGRGRTDDTPDALLKRYEFYVDSVQPSVDYLKDCLTPGTVSLIDAHQPTYRISQGVATLDLRRSIDNVLLSSLKALGLPDAIARALVNLR